MLSQLSSYLWNLATGRSPAIPSIAPVEREPHQTVRSDVRTKSHRPIPPRLSQVVDLLAADANLTSVGLAEQLNVSRGYARTLLNRARLTSCVIVAPAAKELAPAVSAGFESTLQELRQSLDDTRAQVRELTAVPPTVRRNLQLNKRAAILRLREQGVESAQIARELGINPGEVEFVVKVDRFSSQAI